MIKSLEYFDDWYDWTQGQDKKTWAMNKQHQLFIAKVNYKNLKVAITGFFGYADKLLTEPWRLILMIYVKT